ncbi:hypothetical protein SAMN04488693_1272 [Arthrobacter subterraneus]|uniref:Uncharacterized protein n=1 Tax=Arthrobacter subterraneus TaxID=335973 RepID=A0A1G8NX16_9MICC|nr:hypothetical protein SAMN04488693_1272 [Arthrobacter subterraneus]
MTTSEDEPDWMARMREASKQRPRTQFRKIAWSDLQKLLRERDVLWREALPESRARVDGLRQSDSGKPAG